MSSEITLSETALSYSHGTSAIPLLGETIGASLRRVAARYPDAEVRPGAELDTAAVREHCQGKIAHYKIPRYVRFTAEFPMTVTGKIQKFKMRETSVTEFDLADASDARTA